MPETELRTHRLLIIEDNPADADLIEALLEQSTSDRYEIVKTATIAEAIQRLPESIIEVVLLDLSLPDSTGIASVEAIRAVVGNIPIVVLTGADDEQLGLACIEAGAQDYLLKGEIRSIVLRRTIGYAISRLREAQLRDLRTMLAQLRELSSANAQTTTTAMLAGTQAMRERFPKVFGEIVGDYLDLLNSYLGHLEIKRTKPRDRMTKLITRLGEASIGPRDLLDVHIAALDMVVEQSDSRTLGMVIEGRLLALEMMGLLVDYYRVRQR
jgi:DNA-binding NarL/FixJ family response regulator